MLNGKIALITGGSRGIGAGIALRLARDGASVAVHYANRSDAADAIVKQAQALGAKAVAIRADLSDARRAGELVDATLSALGGLDILVNNAGFGEFNVPVGNVTADHYARTFDLNVRGLILVTAAAVGRLRDGGRIINISSGVVGQPPPGASVYAASKAAVNTLTQTWAKELGTRQITVNAVSPGVTESELMRSILSEPMLKEIALKTALGRIGDPRDIADVVAFIASEEARWVTGQILGADGGLN